MILPSDNHDKIWLFDFFINDMVEYKIICTNPNPRPTLMLDIMDSGVYVIYSVQALVKTECQMNFTSYPFDTQTCRLEITSFDREVTFEPVFINESRSVLEFKIQVQTLHEKLSVKDHSHNVLSKNCKLIKLISQLINT